jgi:hypothetical protein
VVEQRLRGRGVEREGEGELAGDDEREEADLFDVLLGEGGEGGGEKKEEKREEEKKTKR